MCTNISSLLSELESYGVPSDRAAELAAAFIKAGHDAAWAAVGEIAGKATVGREDLENIAAVLVAA